MVGKGLIFFVVTLSLNAGINYFGWLTYRDKNNKIEIEAVLQAYFKSMIRFYIKILVFIAIFVFIFGSGNEWSIDSMAIGAGLVLFFALGVLLRKLEIL